MPPQQVETNGHVGPEDGVEKGQLESGEVENSNKEGPPPAPAVDSSPTDESTTEPPLRQPAKSRVIRRRPGRRMNKAKVKVSPFLFPGRRHVNNRFVIGIQPVHVFPVWEQCPKMTILLGYQSGKFEPENDSESGKFGENAVDEYDLCGKLSVFSIFRR